MTVALNLDAQIQAARDEHVERVLSLRGRLREVGATAEDETHRTVFLQMARVWVALAEKEETSADRNRGEENRIEQ